MRRGTGDGDRKVPRDASRDQIRCRLGLKDRLLVINRASGAAGGSKTVAPGDRFHDPSGVWPMNEFEQTADG